MKKKFNLLIAFVCSFQIANAQNVGIGTTTPLYPLHLQTPGNVSSWGVMHTNGNVYLGSFIYQTGIAEFGTRSNHPFYLFANNNDNPPAIAIDNSGINVGIGNTSPLYNLDLHGAGNAQFNLREGIGGQTALFSRYTNRLEIQPSDAFEISVGGIDRRNLCVANNGYVGIETSTPANLLQVGSYTNSNYGGNQLALGFGTNVTVMNQYASLSNFQSTTALNIQSAKDIYLMPHNGDGHVGINTNTPTYPLEINATSASWVTDNADAAQYGVGFASGGIPGPSTSGTSSETDVELYVNGTIEAGTYFALSDARIKNIIGITNTQNDLETLDKIKITDYTMKDKITYGNKNFKKVIAQELEEVYPQAVNRQVNFIPNTYLQTDKVIKNDSGYVLHFNKAHNISKIARVLKVFSQKGDAKLQVTNVLSDFDVAVKAENLSDHLFVYGEQVDDFGTVDYEGLTTLNISATQRLSKLLKEQQELVTKLSEEIDTLEKKLNQLENKK